MSFSGGSRTTYGHLIRAASTGLVATGASLILVLPAAAAPVPTSSHTHGGSGAGYGSSGYGDSSGYGRGTGSGRSSHWSRNGGKPDVKPRGDQAEHTPGPDGLDIQPGKIKHVWLIVMENKSHDDIFSGLNDNTYLWKTLPSQGVLLTPYYGTGQFQQRQLPHPSQRPSHRHRHPV